MKKAILTTAGIVLSISALTATSVYLPTLRNTISVKPGIVDFSNNQKFNYKKQISVGTGIKEAILGTKDINNGNYVLYIGNMAYQSNINFLFSKTSTGNNLTPENLASNEIYEMNGDFAKSIKWVQSNQNDFENVKFISYYNVLSVTALKAKQSYDNLVIEYKNLGANDKFLDPDTDAYKQYNWALSAPAFNFNPDASYRTWNNKTVKFLNSKSNEMFKKLESFIKSVYPTSKNIADSSGFIVGFKNGQRVSDYSGSFDAPPPPADDPSGETPPATRAAVSNIIPTEPTSEFYTWLQTNYGKTGTK